MRKSPLLAVTLHWASLSYLLCPLWAVLLSKQPDNPAGSGPSVPVQANHNVCVCVYTMSKKRARPSAHTGQSNPVAPVPNGFVLKDLDKHGRIKAAAALGTQLWMVPKSPWTPRDKRLFKKCACALVSQAIGLCHMSCYGVGYADLLCWPGKQSYKHIHMLLSAAATHKWLGCWGVTEANYMDCCKVINHFLF